MSDSLNVRAGTDFFEAVALLLFAAWAVGAFDTAEVRLCEWRGGVAVRVSGCGNDWACEERGEVAK